jgi:hypothetical protein
MSEPVLLLQIVSATHGTLARLPGGGSLEADLTELITQHILAKGVSFKTEAHVERDVRLGIREAIMSLKNQTKYLF